jgi:hypothetical protein
VTVMQPGRFELHCDAIDPLSDCLFAFRHHPAVPRRPLRSKVEV